METFNRDQYDTGIKQQRISTHTKMSDFQRYFIAISESNLITPITYYNGELITQYVAIIDKLLLILFKHNIVYS